MMVRGGNSVSLSLRHHPFRPRPRIRSSPGDGLRARALVTLEFLLELTELRRR